MVVEKREGEEGNMTSWIYLGEFPAVFYDLDFTERAFQ